MEDPVYWTCRIGPAERDSVPDGGDLPLRVAVGKAFHEVTGVGAQELSSGWGRTDCNHPGHTEPFACHRVAEGGFVCESTLLLEQEGPHLGLATTDQLLIELEARFQIDSDTWSYNMLRKVRDWLPEGRLQYRTFDS